MGRKKGRRTPRFTLQILDEKFDNILTAKSNDKWKGILKTCYNIHKNGSILDLTPPQMAQALATAISESTGGNNVNFCDLAMRPNDAEGSSGTQQNGSQDCSRDTGTRGSSTSETLDIQARPVSCFAELCTCSVDELSTDDFDNMFYDPDDVIEDRDSVLLNLTIWE